MPIRFYTGAENPLRNRRGQFTSGQKGLRASQQRDIERLLLDRNRRLALDVQDDVVGNIEGRIQRVGSTGRLVRVTGQPGNVRYSSVGIEVGIPSFLDRSVAKYWRQIEEGFEGHVGRPIFGSFYDGTQWSRPRAGGYGGRFITGSEARAMGLLRKQYGPGIIAQPIEAMDAYRDASYDVGERASAIMRSLLSEI